jgi:NAD(P)-dependent dehydrogenase (short-subunit alcohol dehydrogenase family)
MALQLQDKVIVITGALGAAGHAAVKLFAEKGAFVAACDLKPESDFPELESLRDRFGDDRLFYVKADMTKEDHVQGLIESIERTWGRLDGCYNTVYVNRYQRIAEQSLEYWEDSIRGTLTSAFLVNKYAAELMMASGGGSIVNVSSVLGSIPLSKNAAYGAGKAGLEQLTRVVAVEYAEYGIRANAVVPGDFKVEQEHANASQQHIATMRQKALLGRSGFPIEINEVAAFLLSDAASYVTGSMYPVTGGLWLTPN